MASKNQEMEETKEPKAGKSAPRTPKKDHPGQ